MFKKQITVNIQELDSQIGKLTQELAVEVNDEKFELTTQKLKDLIELRTELYESKVKNSVKPLVVSGLFGLTSVVIVLKYEEANVITSKAWSTAIGMFRGGR